MSNQLVGPRVCDKVRERQSNNNNNKCLASKKILEESEDPVLDELNNIVIVSVLC